jgi:tetratricopeptide (TPR) repeat protein
MTNRPRSHVLEARSKTAFRAAAPDSWAIEDVSSDYGLDLKIETFQNGAATGMMFFVQLKATDQPDVGEALKLPVSENHRTYWNSLDCPVLIVRWLATTDELYSAWSWNHDPKLKEGQKSATLTFTEVNRWTPTTHSDVEETLELYRRLTSGKLPNPLTVALRLDPSLKEVTPIRLVNNLRSVLGSLDERFGWRTDAGPANFEVVIHPKSIRVSLLFGRITMHIPVKKIVSSGSLPYDIVLLLGCALEQIEPVVGSQLIAQAYEFSNLIHMAAAVSGQCLRVLRQAGRHDVLLSIGERLIACPAETAKASGLYFLAGAGAPISALNQEQLARFENALKGLPVPYNWAGYLKVNSRFDEALAAYAEALLVHPEYERSAYFHSEVAGIHFELGAVSEAAVNYRKSLEIEEDPQTRYLLADSLAACGLCRCPRSAWPAELRSRLWRISSRTPSRLIACRGEGVRDRISGAR